MSFFKDIKDQGQFNEHASESLNRAAFVLNNTVSTSITPYYNFTSHAKSATHPFIHIAQLIRNAARLIYGAFILTCSLLSLNLNGAANTLGSMAILILASALEVVNITLAIASFVTRTLASILNLGYKSLHINAQAAPLKNRECGEQDIELTIKNMRTDMMLAAKDNIAKSTDDTVHNVVFTLI
jgi:hypothetical protein